MPIVMLIAYSADRGCSYHLIIETIKKEKTAECGQKTAEDLRKFVDRKEPLGEKKRSQTKQKNET